MGRQPPPICASAIGCASKCWMNKGCRSSARSTRSYNRMNDESRTSQKIEISGDQLTIPDVATVARDKHPVRLSGQPAVRQKISASREVLEEKIRRGEIIYGVNTGLGGNVRFILPAKDIAAHQENIFRFLICGTGNPLPEDAVRAAMLLRANALAKGYSAVRLVVIERLLELLNHEITPVVPI